MKKFFCLAALLLMACQDVPTHPASMVHHDRRSPDIITVDKNIEQAALEEFRDDAELQMQSHVNINVYNGLALVTGEVLDPSLKNKILETVRIIPHVKMVRDSLNIAPLSNRDSRSNDAELAKQVQSALKQIQTLPNFDSSMVKVVCESGTIYLMGLVTKEEGDVVVNVTRLQPNVKQIVKVFEYIQ